MARKEKIKAKILMDPDEPNVLIIRPIDKMNYKSNSVYTLSTPEFIAKDNSIIEKASYEYITEPTPYYVSLNDVQGLAHGLELDDKSILFHIREACLEVDFWIHKMKSKGETEDMIVTRDNIKTEYYPFYMYIKYISLYNCLKEYYIHAITKPNKVKEQLADLSKEEAYDLNAIKKLLDDTKKEADDWLEWIVTITADPKWAVRGKYSLAINNSFSRPYHSTGLTGYNRGY